MLSLDSPNLAPRAAACYACFSFDGPWRSMSPNATPAVRLPTSASEVAVDVPVTSAANVVIAGFIDAAKDSRGQSTPPMTVPPTSAASCLLYTSDAADDMQCVDLGGRRIIKKTGYVLCRVRCMYG